MPINTQYAGYEDGLKKSTQVKDFAAGDIKVKSKGEDYLPKLTGQTQAEYNAYLNRGAVIPAVSPTVSAITGAIMRKESLIETTIVNIESNINGKDQDVKLFTCNAIAELLLSGGVGQLVEWDNELNAPTVKTYTKESLINYSYDYIVLTQNYTVRDQKDKFKETVHTEYLELTYDESGNYIQNRWRKTKNGFAIVEVLTPTNRGAPLKEIPFVFVTIGGLGIANTDPLLLNLSNVNLNQYRLSADQRHGLHWTALPTLFVFGAIADDDGNKKQIKVGAGSFNHIEDESARVELLEFSGAGLASVKSAIDDDINTMSSIGAKMLTSEQGGVKAAETARIDASSETATLSTIANAIDLMMNEIFRIIDEWAGTTGSTYAINRDFVDVKVDPQALQAYLQTYLSGGMSLDTFLNLLYKGELLPKGITPEDEADRIEQGGNDFADNTPPDNLAL